MKNKYGKRIKRRQLNTLVHPATLSNLHELKVLCGYDDVGHVIDKLVRDRMAIIVNRTPLTQEQLYGKRSIY